MPDTFLTGSIDLILNNLANVPLRNALVQARNLITQFNKTGATLNLTMPKIAPLNKSNLNNITAYEQALAKLVTHTSGVIAFTAALEKLAMVKLPNLNRLSQMGGMVNQNNFPGVNGFPPSVIKSQLEYLAILKLIAAEELNIKNLKSQQIQSQQKANTGLTGWLASSAQMLATQVYYAAVWTTIYGTINSINTSIKEGIQLFAQLEQGLGRAMSTGLNKEQVKNAFTPETPGGPGFEGTKQSMKDLAGLQALLFTSQHKANVEQ